MKAIKWTLLLSLILGTIVVNTIQLTETIADDEDKYGKPDDAAKPKDYSIETETVNRYRSKMKNKDALREELSGTKKPKPIENRKDQDKQTLTVHMIAHTHDDIGWLKTIDEYYSGTNKDSQLANVGLIITGVIKELIRVKTRKFTYVEMKFFTMWYTRQTKEMKIEVKKLVKEGRLEFSNGGWSATDEACPNYEDMINNMIIGHNFLKSEFGVKPRTAWHVDAFGHSSANARLFADFGFEAQFFSRLDMNDKEQRLQDKAMQFLWRPQSKHFGSQKQILTSIFRDHYCYIGPFNNDEAFVTDRTLETFNADKLMAEFINYVHKSYTNDYRGSHIALPWGCDFAYQNALFTWRTMEGIIDYINEHNTVNMKLEISTPGTYVDALKSEKITWPVYYHDMFPYSDGNNEYWSGYYTSRPGTKKQVKDGSANFHASSKMYAQMAINQQTTEVQHTDILRAKTWMMDALGVYQHHDAITGTDQQFVSNDYTFRLQKAMDINNNLYQQFLNAELQKQTGIKANSELQTCVGAANDTVTDCPIYHSKKTEFIVIVHNQAAQAMNSFVRIRLPTNNYQALMWSKNQNFEAVEADILEQNHLSNDRIPFTDYEMFVPCSIPANSVAFVKVITGAKPTVVPKSATSQDTTFAIEGFSEEGQAVFRFTNPKEKINQTFGLNLRYYHSHNAVDFRVNNNYADGAYLFKPNQTNQESAVYSKLSPDVTYEQGSNLDQWTLKFMDEKTQQAAIVHVRFSPRFDGLIEFEVALSEVPINDGDGKDVTVNWQFFDDFNANKTFWTDSNGLEMQERRLDFSPSFPWAHTAKDTDRISGNFYPVDSAIAMRDNEKGHQVTILNDRAQAGAAELRKSTIELMQHRRLLQDDNKGVQEFLNETDPKGVGIKVTAKYWMQIHDFKTGVAKQREQQLRIDQQLQTFFSFDNSQPQNSLIQKQNLTQLNEASQSFSSQTTFLAFPVEKNKIMVRFENLQDFFDKDHSTGINQIDINKFATQFYSDANNGAAPSNLNIEELSLSGNQPESDIGKKFRWMGEDDAEMLKKKINSPAPDNGNLKSLEPQRIRTFMIDYNQVQK